MKKKVLATKINFVRIKLNINIIKNIFIGIDNNNNNEKITFLIFNNKLKNKKGGCAKIILTSKNKL